MPRRVIPIRDSKKGALTSGPVQNDILGRLPPIRDIRISNHLVRKTMISRGTYFVFVSG